jgi:trans-2,3-dihydro-3-hydroxyanthranilate isomerase
LATLPSIEAVASALRLQASDICYPGQDLGLHEGGPRFFYVPIASRDALSRAQAREPEWSVILNRLGTVGGYLYAKGGDDPATAYRTRMFNPAGEGAEDPATGSAAALFASHLHKTLRLADGTHAFRLEQGYEMGRPSDLGMEADVISGKLAAVRVAGRAVRVMEGYMSI